MVTLSLLQYFHQADGSVTGFECVMLFAIKVSNFFLTPQQKKIAPLLIVRSAH